MKKLWILFLGFVYCAVTTSAAQAEPISAAITVIVSAITANAVRIAVTMALSAAVSMLKKAMQKKPIPPGIKIEKTLTGGTNSRGILLGFYATAGSQVCPPMSHGQDGKTPNAYLTQVIALSDFKTSSLSAVVLNGELIEINKTTTTQYGWPLTGKYAGKAWVKFYDGTQTAVDSMLYDKYVGYIRPWDANRIGTGVSYAIVTYKFDSELFKQEPEIKFEILGAPLYDPRFDTSVGGSGTQRWDDMTTHVFTTNTVVQIYNIKRGIRLAGGQVYGGVAEAADLPLDNWVAAMNVCDEITDTGDKRYQSGYEIAVADEQPADVIEELLKACSGAVSEVGGTYKIRVGPPSLPVAFITDDDILVSEEREFDPYPTIDGSVNTIYAAYPHPGETWNTHDAPVVTDATYVAEDDGVEQSADLQFPACPFPLQVQRNMLAWLKDDRRWRRHNIPMGPYAFAYEPLDVISWTSARNQYTNKSFEIGLTSNDLMRLNSVFALREVDPDDYSWTAADELPDPVQPGSWDLPAVQAVPGWSVTASSVTDGDGTDRRPALLCGWTADAAEDAKLLKIQVRLVETAELVSDITVTRIEDGSTLISEGILPTTFYEARAEYIVDRPTEWSDWLDATTGDLRYTDADINSEALNTNIADVQDLIEVYGDTASAAASAAAAEAAKNAAQTAQTNAETAETQAEAAKAAADTAAADALTRANAAGASATSAAASAVTATTQAGNASTSASAAATSASGAAASNTAAGNSASAANTAKVAAEAARDAASASATASASSASSAAASNTAAGNSASAAATSATNASTSAGNAATSASAASTSATNAAGSANTATTQANASAASATASGNSATASAGSASAASTSAGNAAASATSATSSANTATTQAGNASTSATAASTSAAAALASSSAAATSATLAASLSPGLLNKSPTFADNANATGAPTQYTLWGGLASNMTRIANRYPSYGPYGVQVASVAGNDAGFYSATQMPDTVGWYVIEADIRLIAGTLVGAGVGLYDAIVGLNLAFSTDKDTSDTVRGAGTVGQAYSFRKLVQKVNNNVGTLYAFTSYGSTAFGSNSTARTIAWDRVGVRMATSAEIAAQRADTNATLALAQIATEASTRASETSALATTTTTHTAQIGSLNSSVSANTTAIADSAAKIAAARFVLTTAASGGKPARFTLYSDNLGTDFIGLEASEIYFGDNTVFDDASDTLQTTTGGKLHVTAWGAVFGATGANLLEWVGTSPTALSAMTKDNADYWRSTDPPYVGGLVLRTSAPRQATISSQTFSAVGTYDIAEVDFPYVVSGASFVISLDYNHAGSGSYNGPMTIISAAMDGSDPITLTSGFGPSSGGAFGKIVDQLIVTNTRNGPRKIFIRLNYISGSITLTNLKHTVMHLG